MNGKERIITALSRDVPDRVPHFELAYNESSVVRIAKHFTPDLPEIDYIQRMDLQAKVKLFDAAVLVIRELGVDGIVMRVFPNAEFINDRDFRDDWGVLYRVDGSGEAVVLDGPISTLADLHAYHRPAIKPADLLALGYSIEKLGGDRAVILSVQCPFRRSWNLVGGMANLLIAYVDSPELVHRLARIVTDYTKEAIDLGIGMGADAISLDGDLAFNTNTIMSPDQFRRYIKPYYIELVEHVHGHGLPVFKHSDGDHSRITQDLVETGFDGLHPIQPQCLDIAAMKQEYGDRLCLLGNIDCIGTLVSGSVADVEEEVRRTVEIAAPGGGYILTSSNTIHPDVRAENYIAMVKAVHKYGIYADDNSGQLRA
jgi:uroporphyrinogen decarboxylase